MSLNYCDITASWTAERTEALLSAFVYQVSQPDGGEKQLSQAEVPVEGGHGSCQLSCEGTGREADKPEPCVIELMCKTPYNVSVVGVEICSESRTQELYDDTNTYIMTTQLLESTKGDNNSTMYRSKACWEQPLSQCSIKFLSLGRRETFRLSRVVVHLVQGAGDKDAPTSTSLTSHIDMSKVKDLVGSMGSRLSDRAQAFMTTMEQYQQNQEASFADMEKMISKTSGSPDTKTSGAGDMSRLVSMFATMNKLKQQMPTTNSDSMPQVDLTSLGQSLGHPVLGENGSVDKENPMAMFSFLKNICGKVSKMRESENDLKYAALSSEEDKANLQNESKPASLDTSDASLSQLEQRLLLHLNKMEARLEAKVEEKLQKLEDNFNKKLDRILELLSQPVPGGGDLYESSDDSSVSSAGELTLD